MGKKDKQKKGGSTHGSLQDQLLSKGLARKNQIPKEKVIPRPQFSQTKDDMFNIDQTRLPKDTQDVLKNTEPDNFALKLNRRILFKPDKEGQSPKPVLFKKKTKYDVEYRVSFQFNPEHIKEISNRQLFAIQQLELECSVMEFSIDWRLIVGLGIESVYETSMTLHHVHGFPYIPASAVKGTVRNLITAEVFGEKVDHDGKTILDLKHAEERAADNQYFRYLFGTTDVAGKIRFFDAFPVTDPKIDTDIMNPHFGDYYGDQANIQPPADYLTPVPLPFLTIKDTIYRFVIGVRKDDNVVVHDVAIGQGVSLLEAASRWLENALTGQGIGAKTAVGYGYLSLQSRSS
jgi:CRISPR-associated protein Cmr6